MASVVIVLGSKSDLADGQKIQESLKGFGLDSVARVASAHRTPRKVLEIAEKYENVVFIVVAGLSNALSGMLACATSSPIISCPVYAPEDVMSTLRMPGGVAHATVLKPENAALMAAKIIGLSNAVVAQKVKDYLAKAKKKVEEDDATLSG